MKHIGCCDASVSRGRTLRRSLFDADVVVQRKAVERRRIGMERDRHDAGTVSFQAWGGIGREHVSLSSGPRRGGSDKGGWTCYASRVPDVSQQQVLDIGNLEILDAVIAIVEQDLKVAALHLFGGRLHFEASCATDST